MDLAHVFAVRVRLPVGWRCGRLDCRVDKGRDEAAEPFILDGCYVKHEAPAEVSDCLEVGMVIGECVPITGSIQRLLASEEQSEHRVVQLPEHLPELEQRRSLEVGRRASRCRLVW